MKDFYSQNGIGTRKLTRQKIKSLLQSYFPLGGAVTQVPFLGELKL